MNKAWWIKRRGEWQRAIMEIAREYGEGSPIYRALGSAAWGRMPLEGNSLQDAIFGTGYLEGLRAGLMEAGAIYKMEGGYALRRIHERIEKGA